MCLFCVVFSRIPCKWHFLLKVSYQTVHDIYVFTTGATNLTFLVNVVSALLLHYEIIIFTFVNTYLWGESLTFSQMSCFSQKYLLIYFIVHQGLFPATMVTDYGFFLMVIFFIFLIFFTLLIGIPLKEECIYLLSVLYQYGHVNFLDYLIIAFCLNCSSSRLASMLFCCALIIFLFPSVFLFFLICSSRELYLFLYLSFCIFCVVMLFTCNTLGFVPFWDLRTSYLFFHYLQQKSLMYHFMGFEKHKNHKSITTAMRHNNAIT